MVSFYCGHLYCICSYLNEQCYFYIRAQRESKAIPVCDEITLKPNSGQAIGAY